MEIIHTPPDLPVDNSSMNSGYATDGLNGSSPNKRSCSDDGDAAASTTVHNKHQKMGGKYPIPLKVDKTVAGPYIASLNPGLHKVLAKYAHAVLWAYATYFWAESEYTRENNDSNYIPQLCRITLALQPTTRVAKSNGF